MAECKYREKLIELFLMPMILPSAPDYKTFLKVVAEAYADRVLANDFVEVVRCKDCKFATELDKHCEISRTAYKHCALLRGDETRYVWHKYKKYYKDYSIVSLDDFCSSGERRCEE